jgi:hypothetical protein
LGEAGRLDNGTAEGAFWSELVLDRGALGGYRLDELPGDLPVLRVVPVDLVSLEVVEAGHHGEPEIPPARPRSGPARSTGSNAGSRLSSAATCCFCSSVASAVQRNIATCLIMGRSLACSPDPLVLVVRVPSGVPLVAPEQVVHLVPGEFRLVHRPS